MALYLLSGRFPPPSSPKLLSYYSASNSFLYFFFSTASINTVATPTSKIKKWIYHTIKSNVSSNDSLGNATTSPPADLLHDDLVPRLLGAKDAAEVLDIISYSTNVAGGTVSPADCCSIISAALERGNADLALSIFCAMRTSIDPCTAGAEKGSSTGRWKWSRPNVTCYALLILGLASLLRVSDAIKVVANVCRVGVTPGEEVPFGKVVRCPTCMIAIAVAQPQHGSQVVSCSKCRYQYELFSGSILSIESEEISMDVPAWRRTLRFLQILKKSIPAAVHSIVVETPYGMARTHRFATETVELPAQVGERVTIALATPSNIYREVGPLKISPKIPNYYPGEPIYLTNHDGGRESSLLRAPSKDRGSTSLMNPSILFPVIAVLATGDAATGFIDPSLPQLISVAAVSSLALGATFNSFVFPQLSKLPQRFVDTIAIKQKLLSQYDVLQSRINKLKGDVENEVWMYARMCQLENKILAVGEPSYRTRRSRVKRVREGLENSITKRIELIESYARISSMIEIEIEMDSDVLIAEGAINAENIAEQINQIMEIERLEEKWKVQAEANDEAERLLSSDPEMEQEQDQDQV